MLYKRFVATPFGVRVDYRTSDEGCFYSAYIPGSVPSTPGVDLEARFWRRISIGSFLVVLLEGIVGVVLSSTRFTL